MSLTPRPFCRLQEQLVLDCLATFEPPARPEPDPVSASSRDLAAAPVRQSSNLLRRLQGVASRDKGTTAAAAAATACPAAATAAPAAASSSLRGRVAAGRAGAVRGEREEDAGGVPSAEPSAALLTTSGSVRSRGGSAAGPGPDYRSKVSHAACRPSSCWLLSLSVCPVVLIPTRPHPLIPGFLRRRN